MKKLTALSIALISVNAFASGTCTTKADWDGNMKTTCSDGSSAKTSKDWDGNEKTVYSDGSSSKTRQNWDGNMITEYSN